MYYFIVNPASQSGKGMLIWNKISDYLQTQNVDYKAYFSKYSGHMRELMYDIAKEHRDDVEPIKVIVLGGDGSLDEILQGIINFDTTYIGYIPCGSSNDFARAMDYKSDPIEILKDILACENPLSLDLGKLKCEEVSEGNNKGLMRTLDTRFFDVSCGIGFDAEVCALVEKSSTKRILNKLGLGKLVYVAVCLKILFKSACPTVKLILDNDEEIVLKNTRFVVGMNTCFEGGGLKLCPNACPTDGFLDVLTVNDLSALEVLFTLPKAPNGKHLKNKKLHLYRVKQYEIVSEKPLWVHTDGEADVRATHINVSCQKGLLKLLK